MVYLVKEDKYQIAENPNSKRFQVSDKSAVTGGWIWSETLVLGAW